MPGMPRCCGWLSGNAPRAISVVTTGMPVSSASVRSSARGAGADRRRRRRRAPGARDSSDQPGGLADLLGVRPGRPAGSRAGRSSVGQLERRSSPGARTWRRRRAPGRGGRCWRCGTPRRSARGISSGSVTRKLCLVIGIVMPRMSASWKASVPIAAAPTWPVIGDHRHRVHVRVGDRRDQVGRARAGGRHADPDPAGRVRRTPAAAWPAPCSWRTRMCRICGVHQRVVRRQDRAARDAEDVSTPAASSDVIRLCAPVICSLMRLSFVIGAAWLGSHSIKKPLGCRATRGDASAGIGQPARPVRTRRWCRMGKTVAPPSQDPDTAGLGIRRYVVRAPSGVHTQALLPWRSASTQNAGASLVADQRASGGERGLDPLLGDLGRHHDVEVEALRGLRAADSESWNHSVVRRPPGSSTCLAVAADLVAEHRGPEVADVLGVLGRRARSPAR